MRAPNRQPPRPIFEARFVNGTWTVFNRLRYTHGMPLRTQKEALRVAAQLLNGEIKW